MSLLLGGTLILAGLMLLISCLVALVGAPADDFLLLLAAVPGRFFFGAFQIAGLFVPAYVIASGALLASRSFKRTPFLVLNLSVIPFFTLGLLLQLATGSRGPSESGGALAAAVGHAFTPAGGVILCLVLLLVEGLLIAVAAGFRPTGARAAERATSASAERDDPRSVKPIALLAAPSEVSETFVDTQSHVREDQGYSEAIFEAPEETPSMITSSDPTAVGGLFSFPETFADEEVELIDPVDAQDDVFFFHDGTIREGAASATTESDDEVGELDEILPEQKSPEIEAVPVVSKKTVRTGARTARPRGKNARDYQVPVAGILSEYEDGQYWEIDPGTQKAAETLRFTLEEFQIQAEVTGIRKGPVITMFEILPAPGVKLAKIVNLADNIALRLAAQSVRIVAPIPGKHAVGIEIPNKHRAIVSFAELVSNDSFWNPKIEIPVALGKDIPGEAQIVDLAKMPHLLIAGATGSGKSVCVNSLICSILYRKRPDEVKMILIDPKIVELKFYNDIPHLLTPVITDSKRAFQALQYAIYEMERRYSLLDSLGVRDIRSYNNKIRQRNLATEQVPYIVIVVDEFADLMATTGKELESTVARLAAMSRAVGIHLVLATQRPSTDVITGLIKANIPSRIAFMVASKIDSRIIIDTGGAEKLLGGGDMLFASAWDPFPFRMQGAFVSEEEVERIVAHVKTLGEPDYIDDEIFIEDDDETYLQENLEDPLMEQAIDIVVSAGKASASYLQRRLKVGYNRAARLVEELERIGVVGPQNGSKAREIIHIPDRVG
ncbi:MAG TPA: DNA translocase FtsK [Spirochaetia bacterium]|nr:DNA translocase FtsK [Spirochaetia bacterium]